MAIVRTDATGLLENAQARLAELIRQRDQINIDLIQVQRDVQALTAVVWREQLTKSQNNMQQAVVGLSEAVRSILRLQNKPMTAGQVMDALRMMGYNFAGIVNPSALIHNTLKRMAGRGELVYVPAAKTYEFPFNMRLGYTRLTGRK